MQLSVNRYLLTGLAASAMLGSVASLSVAAFIKPIAADLDVSVPMLGQVPASMALAAAVLGLISGPLADACGSRLALLAGLLTLVCFGVAVAAAPTFALLIAAVVIGAIGRSVIAPVTQALAGSEFAGARQRRAISVVSAGSAGGGIVGVPFLTTFDSFFGWRAAFLLLAAASAAVFSIARHALPSDPIRPSARISVRSVLLAYVPIVRTLSLVGIFVSLCLRSAAAWMMGTYVTAFLIETRDVSVAQAGLIFTAFGAGVFAGSLVAGSGRIALLPLRPTIALSTPLFGAALAAIFLLPVSFPGVLGLIFGGYVVYGVGNVAATVLLLADTPGGRATTMTLNGSAVSLGQAFGGSLGGIVLAYGGYRPLGLGILIMTMLAGAAVFLTRTGANQQSQART